MKSVAIAAAILLFPSAALAQSAQTGPDGRYKNAVATRAFPATVSSRLSAEEPFKNAVLLRSGSGNVNAKSLLKRVADPDRFDDPIWEARQECIYNCHADADSLAWQNCVGLNYDAQYYCEDSYRQQAENCESGCG
jgi:hypothetical protein